MCRADFCAWTTSLDDLLSPHFAENRIHIYISGHAIGIIRYFRHPGDDDAGRRSLVDPKPITCFGPKLV